MLTLVLQHSSLKLSDSGAGTRISGNLSSILNLERQLRDVKVLRQRLVSTPELYNAFLAAVDSCYEVDGITYST